jgi:integrase
MVRGLWRAPTKPGSAVSDFTVGEYVGRWIAQHPTAKDSTKELYRGLLRTCIDPGLGTVRLTGLTADGVREWHYQLGLRLAADRTAERDRLVAAGRSSSAATVRDGRPRQAQAYRLLRAALGTAHADGVIGEQPCRIAGAGTPRSSAERRDLAERLLTATQVAVVAAGLPARYRVLVLAAAWSGLRQGELLALTRADLDLDAVPPVFRVRRRARRSDSGAVDVDSPKSPASRRTVTLPGPLRDALIAHLTEFVPPAADALVFATSRSTVPARSNLTTMLRRAMTAAGLEPVRFHDLRHCAQVLAAESGATLAELMARMGHSTPNAAQVYMHARAERDTALAEALGKAMHEAEAVIASPW